MPGEPAGARQQHSPLPEPSPHTEPQGSKVGCPTLVITRGSSHTIYRCLFYIRLRYEDGESKQLYLIHKHKHREAAKMRRQRNMAQMEEQNKTPEKELNKMEISNLSDAEFKTGNRDVQRTY